MKTLAAMQSGWGGAGDPTASRSAAQPKIGPAAAGLAGSGRRRWRLIDRGEADRVLAR